MEEKEFNKTEKLNVEITETKENERNAQEQKTIIPMAQPEQEEKPLTLEDFGGDINKLFDTYIKRGNIELPPWLEETKKGIEIIPQELFRYIIEREHILSVKLEISKDIVLYKYNEKGFYKIWEDWECKSYIKGFLPTRIRKPYQWKMVFEELKTEYPNTKESELNANENIINFQNGILDLTTGELKPHSPEYLSTIQINCNYIPNLPLTKAPTILRFLQDITSRNADDMATILEATGFTISNLRIYRYKKLIILQGKGNTRQECTKRSSNRHCRRRKCFHNRYGTTQFKIWCFWNNGKKISRFR